MTKSTIAARPIAIAGARAGSGDPQTTQPADRGGGRFALERAPAAAARASTRYPTDRTVSISGGSRALASHQAVASPLREVCMRTGANRRLGGGQCGDPLLMHMRSRTRVHKLAIVALPALVALVLLAIGVGGAAASTPSAACRSVDAMKNGRWHPGPTTAAWQWQLQGKIDTSVPGCAFEVDGFETSKSTVAELHREGVKAICYLDVGSWEEYRPDASEFPKSSLGNVYEGWEEERWLDIAHFHKFSSIMEERIAMCARKGFDGVEPDNVAGWENETGFPLTRADQRRYNLWIARQVHRRGMAVALKNDPGQAKELVGAFDFAVVEECFQYHECGKFEPFVKAGKAVFETEYQLPPAKFCTEAKRLGFAAIRKGLELFAKPWKPCEPLPSTPASTAQRAAGVWRPKPGTTWQWQIVGRIGRLRDVQMYDVDLQDAVPSARTVRVPGIGAARWPAGENAGIIDRLHARGIVAICYLDSGAWESYRPDARLFPKSVIGSSTGWSGERWLDIRGSAWKRFAPIVWARFRLAKQIGCDGIEPDENNPIGNRPGFPISLKDEYRWYEKVAAEAHKVGLSVGMKNGVEVLDKHLAHTFDWSLNEECAFYHECGRERPFISAHKAVFQTEYTADWRRRGLDTLTDVASRVCPASLALGFSTLVKRYVPNAAFVSCAAPRR